MSKLANEAVQKLNKYIFDYWKRLTFHTKWKDIRKWVKWSDWTLINLPHRYIIPSPSQFPEMFYWDSYFSLLGLKIHGLNKLAKGIVDNCLYLIKRLSFFPNANRTFYLTRSQPPYLSQMVLEIFKIDKDKKWLDYAYNIVKKEYTEYWTKEPHLVPEFSLSRYYDRSGKDHEAENESGWDTTNRFDHRCSQILPIDLNCNLYQYELDLAEMAKKLKLSRGESGQWTKLAKKRKELINKYFWNETLGFYFDYDFKKKTQLNYKTLATYLPLWCNLATNKQAVRLMEKISLFKQPGGLATLDHDYGGIDHQWNYPNGWAPLQYLVIKGLDNYGYKKEAREIAERWLVMIIEVFEKDRVIWEKYNVVERKKGQDDYRYKTPAGFGWTNAITVWLMDYLNYEVKRSSS